jgi:UDP-N-acetylglucosamine 2-epimerase
MKRVYICKVLHEDGVEYKIYKLFTKYKKRFGSNIKIFCTDYKLQKRLNTVGIQSEILHSFYQNYAADEPVWEKVYELSDELHASAENDEKLKYSGINFLTLEDNISTYINKVKLTNLCQNMIKQNCETLIIVLTRPFSQYFPDINTSKIKTIKYHSNNITNWRIFAPLKSAYIAAYPLFRVIIHQFPPTFRGLLAMISGSYKKDIRKEHAPSKRTGKRQPRALFVVTRQLHLATLLAICDSCLKNKVEPSVATDDITLITPLQSHHVSSFYRDSMFSVVPYAVRILTLLLRLRKHINSFYNTTNRHQAKTDEFSPTYQCKKTLLENLRTLCYEAVYNITFIEKMINTVSPDIICVMPDMYFLQQMAVVLAKRHGIPTMTCSAAWDFDHPRPLLRRFHVDKIATMGEKVKKAYVNSGIEPDRIDIAGVAHFDRMFNRDKDKDARVLADNGIDSSKKIIVFATQHSVIEMEEMLIGVIKAILKMQNVLLVVKVHPAEDITFYQAIAEKFHDSRIHIVKTIDLYALISNCQLFITQFSTTALEAMMLDKPVITINLSGKPVTVPYAEEGASLGVYKYEDIEPAILKALNDKEIRNKLKAGRYKFVREWAGEPDGKASQRIVDLMKKLIQDSRNRKISKNSA